jgi:hypothetical protein
MSSVVLLATVLAGGCAISEYKTPTAQADLRKIGLSVAAAKCLIDGLHDHYAKEYVSQQVAQPGAPAQVNPREVELYVRNKFAGQDRATKGEISIAKAIAARCRR